MKTVSFLLFSFQNDKKQAIYFSQIDQLLY